MRITHTPNAMLFKERINDTLFVRHRTGMRRSSLLPACGTPRLDCDDRQITRACIRGGTRQDFRIGNIFKVQQHQFDFRVVCNRPSHFSHSDVSFIAGGVYVTHTDATLAQQAVHHRTHAATLTQHRNRPILRRTFNEHGREPCNRPSTEICQAVSVRTIDAHTCCTPCIRHALLSSTAFWASLAKA